MKFGKAIAIMTAAGVAACSSFSWPKLPDMPKLPSFSFAAEGTEERPPISCQAATRLNLQALDWPNAKRLDVMIRRAKFAPGTLVMKLNTPNVIRITNGDRDVRTFRAEEFFRASSIARIVYDGRTVPETCIDAIRIGPLKSAELLIVPLRKGEYLYGESTSRDPPLTPFGDESETGQIIVR
jgi:hypothetical protein